MTILEKLTDLFENEETDQAEVIAQDLLNGFCDDDTDAFTFLAFIRQRMNSDHDRIMVSLLMTAVFKRTEAHHAAMEAYAKKVLAIPEKATKRKGGKA